MLTGNWSRNSQRFVCDSQGRLTNGFVYEDSDGIKFFWADSYVTGWYDVDEGVYFDGSRAPLSGRFYFDPDTGYAVTGTVEIDGAIYTFDDNGQFLHDGEHIDADGDGNCDRCDTGEDNDNFFVRLWNMFLAFLQRIVDFFTSLFQ